MIIDADAHVEESPAMFEYLEKKFYPRRPLAVPPPPDTVFCKYHALWLIGEDSYVLGADYPHGDPSRQEDMVAEFRERADLSSRLVEKMLSDNHRRLYAV